MNKKLGMMALTGALALVACSQGGGGPAPTTNHTLTVNFSGVSSAPIVITDSKGAVVDTETVSSGFKKTLPAGTYTVTPGTVSGYNAPTPASASANLNTADAAVSFTYTAIGTPIPTVAKTVNLISIKDENNVALPYQQEVNDNKVATLFTAQTEESVCVIAKVTDANNAPVANTAVTLTVSDTYATLNGGIVVADGCGAGINAQSVTKQATTTPVVTTDANGFARFRLFATYATPNTGFNLASIGPAKIVVQAKDAAGNQLDPLELKGFFLNMSHLYVAEATPGSRGFGAPSTYYRTKTRVGDSTGYTNVFGSRTNPTNEADFGVFAYVKQPQLGPVLVPASVSADQFSYLAPGYVQYDLSGADAASFEFVSPANGGVGGAFSTDPNFGNSAQFKPIDRNNFPYSEAAVSFRDYGSGSQGQGVRIIPRPGVTVPTDRPLNVTVKATYVFETTFGNTTYDFPLKDVTINKTYQSSFLTINKTVDNHVLTWAGPELTMNATGEKQAEPLIANYTITVKNTSQTPAYNVTVKDSLPAEIGLALPADQLTNVAGVGGTYDTTLHQVTWNYTTTPALVRIDPGATVTLKFPIYARQKPGFQWDTTAANGDYTGYVIKPRIPAAAAPFNPYPDPYVTRNGNNGSTDVTVGFFPTPDVTLANQVVTDFNSPDDRADVWVVRPEFRLNKVLLSENPSQLGASNFYQITLNQIDQIGNGGLYSALAQKYPYEFTKTSTATTAGDTAKANPYGVNVKLSDAWDYGLDYTNSTAFSIYENSAATTTGTGGVITGTAYQTAPTAPTTGRSVTWTAVPLFERDDVGATQLALTSSVPSPVADPNRPNGWLNCAYLQGRSLTTTNNLNQPANDTAIYASSIYATNPAYPAPWQPNTIGQTEIGNGSTAVPGTLLATGVTAPTATPPSQAILGTALLPVQTGLESCASVVVVANQTSALTFTNRGEYTDNGGTITPANAKDGYAVGNTFYYKFDSQNTGTAAANGVTATFVRSNDNVTFPTTGTYVAYTFADPAGTGAPTGSVNGTLNSDGSVTFSGISVPAGGSVRFVLTGLAQFSGTTNVNGTLTYTPTGQSQVILNTQEVTTVNQ